MKAFGTIQYLLLLGSFLVVTTSGFIASRGSEKTVKKSFLASTQLTMINDSGDVVVAGVTLKMAFDEEWAVADLSEKKSERFTCGASLDLVHRLRRESDCVLVGRGTVESDDCTLTVRRVQSQKQPTRVVVDPTLQLLLNPANGKKKYKIFQDSPVPTIVYHGLEDAVVQSLDLPESVTCVSVPTITDESNTSFRLTLDLQAMLQDMRLNRDIQHCMVEGGPATARAFLENQLVDRAILIRAPIRFQEPLDSRIRTLVGLELLGSYTCGDDTVECWSRPNLEWPTTELKDWP